MENGPWERLQRLITRLAAVFAVSYQAIVLGLLAVFIIIVTLLMFFFRIFVPNV